MKDRLAPPPYPPPPAHSLPLHAGRAPVVPRAEDREGFRNVLRRRDFRLLWGAQASSQLADKFLMYAILLYSYDTTHLASVQSAVMVAYTFPSVFLSAAAGVYADRHDKKMLMLGANLVRAGLILMIPVISIVPGLLAQVWPLVLITFLFSTAGQIFAPAEAASIPVLVSREQISAATSLFMTTVILTLLLGVPAATLAYRLPGRLEPFFIACGLFLLASLAVWLVRTNLRAERGPEAPAPSLTKELREGVAILRGDPALRWGLAQLAMALMVVFTVFALGPAYLVTALHRSDQDTYVVLIPATIGLAVVAAILGQRSGQRIARARLFVAAAMASGISLMGVGIMPGAARSFHLTGLEIPLVIFFALAFGCGLAAILIPAFTVLQERTTEESRGRIFGGIFTVINVAVTVPLLAAGILADITHSVGGVLAGMGALLVVFAVLGRTVLWRRLGVLDTP